MEHNVVTEEVSWARVKVAICTVLEKHVYICNVPKSSMLSLEVEMRKALTSLIGQLNQPSEKPDAKIMNDESKMATPNVQKTLVPMTATTKQILNAEAASRQMQMPEEDEDSVGA